MKYMLVILLGLTLLNPAIAEASLCKNVTEGTGFIDISINTKKAPDALKMREEYKQKLENIAKELELSKFEITSERVNMYAQETGIDSGLPDSKYTTSMITIDFKFEPHDKIQSFFTKLDDENLNPDLSSDTTVECDSY